MSYDASAYGEIELKQLPTEEMLDELGDVFDYINPLDDGGVIIHLTVSRYDSDYQEQDVWDAVKAIEPITISGSIQFVGEDDTHFEFYFNQEYAEWTEGSADIVWPSESEQYLKEKLVRNKLIVLRDCDNGNMIGTAIVANDVNSEEFKDKFNSIRYEHGDVLKELKYLYGDRFLYWTFQCETLDV